MNNDLKIIKKKYGEKMMHMCREHFSTILDNSPGVLSQILLASFEPNHFLAQDIFQASAEIQFKDYIYDKYHHLCPVNPSQKMTVASPATLLKQAGYTLYECFTENDVQKFKKYFIPNEELCTFKVGRLRNCHIYFAIHENADKLKRQDFANPHRQDEYGTSVISIQFTRDASHTLSIKNRYNHTVINPDATFSNNLDNIVPGLTDSFADYYGMKQSTKNSSSFELPGYIQAADGKFYKYNYEINNIYYCPNNIVIKNFQPIKYPKEKYLLVDYFLFDLVNKKIITDCSDSFTTSIPQIKNISITKKDHQKILTITPEIGDNIALFLNEFNQIISLKNNNLSHVSSRFLTYNTSLNSITLDNVTTIDNDFLKNNCSLTTLSLPQVLTIGDSFLFNSILTTLSLPKVTQIGNWFMNNNKSISSLSLPHVKIIGRGFLSANNVLEKIILPEVTHIMNNFLYTNKKITEINFPQVVKIDDYFLYYNTAINSIELPQVKHIGACFLINNTSLRKIFLPKLEYLGDYFLHNNNLIEEFFAPLLTVNSEKSKVKLLNK